MSSIQSRLAGPAARCRRTARAGTSRSRIILILAAAVLPSPSFSTASPAYGQDDSLRHFSPAKKAPPGQEAAQRAVDYLAREVPRWTSENDCYSCHNNGDAARALYVTRSHGYRVAADALNDTDAWLRKPARWKNNGGDARFSDKRLAALQFAHALATAADAGVSGTRPGLTEAAEHLRSLQDENGSWHFTNESLIGSPVTYGRALATVAARRVLVEADAPRLQPAVERANVWLREKAEPRSVLDAAAVLIGLNELPAAVAARAHEAEQRQRRHCLQILEKGQASDGGWGPFVNSRPEAFDTALALLALAPQTDQSEEIAARVRRGRAYLKDTQLGDGSWNETTRPSGSESYAHRVSTTAWATLALLATAE